jgi:hypothetical protein
MSFFSFFNLDNSINDDIELEVVSFSMNSILLSASCKLSRAILTFLKFNFIFSSVAKDLISFRFLFIPNASWSDFMGKQATSNIPDLVSCCYNYYITLLSGC